MLLLGPEVRAAGASAPSLLVERELVSSTSLPSCSTGAGEARMLVVGRMLMVGGRM